MLHEYTKDILSNEAIQVAFRQDEASLRFIAASNNFIIAIASLQTSSCHVSVHVRLLLILK